MTTRKEKKVLLGLGLDHLDGHKRVTKGENFILLGGSKETHEEMQEKAIKFNEELKRKKKRMDQIEPKEFNDIANKVGLHPVEKTQNSRRSHR